MHGVFVFLMLGTLEARPSGKCLQSEKMGGKPPILFGFA
jgi:hypothetical protein